MQSINNFFKPVYRPTKLESADSTSSSSSFSEAVSKALPECPEKMFILEETDKESHNKRKCTNVPAEIKYQCAKFAFHRGPAAAVMHFTKNYAGKNYKFTRTTVRDWVKKFNPGATWIQNEVAYASTAGRPNTIPLEILATIKDIISSLRLTGCVIQRPRVIAITKGAIKAENPSLLKECGGDIMLTDRWARTLLTNMNYVRRKETT